jgi:hypothetical protein
MRHPSTPVIDPISGRPVAAPRRALWSWAAGCGVLLCAAAWGPQAAAAEHLLFVDAANTNGECGSDPSGNTYFGEAWGYDSSGNIVCEASEMIGIQSTEILLGAECNTLLGTAVTHAAALTTRNPNNTYAYVGTVLQTGRSSSWNVFSPTTITFNAPASCGGGATINVASIGIDTTSN